MFDQMRALGALTTLMKDRQKLADAAARIKARLGDARVEAEAGGGAIRVVATGSMKIAQVHIEPAMAAAFSADERSRELAQALIAEATNDALARAQELAREVVGEEAKALGLPADLHEHLGGSLGSALGL
ncbi:MAG: YbaB/EbfC family nucleoid-associated protein [Phycisphaerales bacterium]